MVARSPLVVARRPLLSLWMSCGLLLALSVGCGLPELFASEPERSEGATPARGTKPGLTQIFVEGADIGGRRSAWVHMPAASGGNLPVVLAFHGGKGTSGHQMVKRFEHVFHEPVLFVFPNGQSIDPREAAWTGVGRPSPGGDEMVDVRFVGRLIDELATRYPIDPKRVYATGFSNGGQMTWNLVCATPDRFAGIAVVGKTVTKKLTSRCELDRPMPLLFMQGTADQWGGGTHTMSAEDSVRWWLTKQGCRQQPDQVGDLPDRGDATRVERRQYRCPSSATEVFVIHKGGHFWPRKGERGPPAASRDVDASEEILRFFRQHAGL